MSERFTHDLIVIGAGPAGMAAAACAAEAGLRTLLIDEQLVAGGQIYRRVRQADEATRRLLGPDYAVGHTLVERLRGSAAEHLAGALAWDIGREGAVTVLHEGVARAFSAPQRVVANGAMERPSPIPGWTLPGVMNAGAAQIAMKTDALVPDVPVVLAGGGPLLLLVACQLLEAGAGVAALVETPAAGQRLRALPHLAAALKQPSYLLKGLKMVARLRRSGVPWHRAATDLAVIGEDRATGLSFTAGRRRHRVDAGLVLLHHGVIPNTQIARLLRLSHRWSDERLAWEVVVDGFGQTSLPGVRMAGDGTAITGANAAALAGELAALGAAHALGRIDQAERDRRAAPLQAALAREQAVRPFLDTLYRPPGFITTPPDEVTVCRCEEVTAGRIREMARLGCQGPNQTKFFSRCGMGPCQGRVCGTVVTQVLAQALGRPEAEVGAYRIRAPIKPVPLGALAAMADGDGGPTGH